MTKDERVFNEQLLKAMRLTLSTREALLSASEHSDEKESLREIVEMLETVQVKILKMQMQTP